ncbi:hypothetical protein NQZ68_022531 [Dissostichus eleginoides]|nr:hypothetical protein NQZ68_022531 [Dissostichus eleginoides]
MQNATFRNTCSNPPEVRWIKGVRKKAPGPESGRQTPRLLGEKSLSESVRVPGNTAVSDCSRSVRGSSLTEQHPKQFVRTHPREESATLGCFRIARTKAVNDVQAIVVNG